MPLTLTCDCGARFDLPDLLAGGVVACPECRQPLEAPSAAAEGRPRTSYLALLSVVLALAGAFTLVGSAAAVVLAAWSLLGIRRHKGRLAGARLAAAALALAVVTAALTLAVLARPRLLPVDVWLRARTLAGQVDLSGPAELRTRDGAVTVKRPSPRWGRLRDDRSDDPAVGELQHKRELLLADLSRHAYLDVSRRTDLAEAAEYARLLDQDLLARHTDLDGEEDNPFRRRFSPTLVVREGGKRPAVGDWQVREWTVVVRRGGQKWKFLVRACKKGRQADPRNLSPTYILRGYAPARHFPAVEDELRAALDGIALPK
jgi:hypothetical protein